MNKQFNNKLNKLKQGRSQISSWNSNSTSWKNGGMGKEQMKGKGA